MDDKDKSWELYQAIKQNEKEELEKKKEAELAEKRRIRRLGKKIDRDSIYCFEDIQELLNTGTNKANDILAEAKVYRDSKKRWILGKNLIDYLDKKSY